MLTANQRCYSKQPLHSRDVTDSEFVFQTRRYWDTGNEVTQLGYMYNTYNSCAFSALTLLVGHPACKKTEWWGAGIVICLERSADCIWPSWCHCVCVTTRHCCTIQTTTSSSEQHKDNDVAMLHGRWRHYRHGEMTTMMLPRREATSSRRAVSIAIKLTESSDAIHRMHAWRHGCACVLWMESLLLMSWITAGKRTCNARSVISTLIHWHHVKAVVYC